MLALVNSRNPESTNQQALDVAVQVLMAAGNPYHVFLEHERYMTPDPYLSSILGKPDEDMAHAWMAAEDCALNSLPLADDEVYLVWIGDN